MAEQDEAATLAQLAALNQKVNDQEARGLALIAERDAANAQKDAMIAAKDTTIGELNDLVAQLQNKPNMTSDEVVQAIQGVASNLDDNFVAAQTPTP